MAKRVAEFERDNKKLADRLKQAESIIVVQKKISEILGDITAQQRRQEFMSSVADLSNQTCTKAACEALGVPRATYYRQSRKTRPIESVNRPSPPLALTATEEQCVLDVLHESIFHDYTPYYVYATLLDEGTYYCSIRTM